MQIPDAGVITPVAGIVFCCESICLKNGFQHSRVLFQQASNPSSNTAPSWKQKKQQTSAVNGGSSAPPKPAKPPHTSAPSFASGGGGTARFVPPTDGPANIAMAMEATAEIQGMIGLYKCDD